MFVRNSLAHLVARIASLVAGLVAIPLVSLTLGNEALGMLGVYATLQAMLGLFDLGLSTAANRELSVLIGRRASAFAQAQLIRSIESSFWIGAGLFLILGWAAVGYLADGWFTIENFSAPMAERVLMLIVAGAAIRFPVAFYSNVLFALNRHIYPNVILVISATLRTLVSVVALTKFNIGLQGFFTIQLVANTTEVFLLLLGVWIFNRDWRVRPSFEPLRHLDKQIGILTAIGVTAVGLSQVDKIILSKILTLGEFGIYSAAYTLVSGLVTLSYPIGNAVFPELCRRLDRNDGDLAWLVRSATELTLLVIVPLGAVMALQPTGALNFLFLLKPLPPELIGVMPVMALGGIAQAFVTLPHLYQVAASRADKVLWVNGLFFFPYAALVLSFAVHWGAFGAALAFTTFNIARLFVHWIILLKNAAALSSWRTVPFLVSGIIIVCICTAWIVGVLPETKIGKMLMAAATTMALTVAVGMILPASQRRFLAWLPRIG